MSDKEELLFLLAGPFLMLSVPLALGLCALAGLIGGYHATQNIPTILCAFGLVIAGWFLLCWRVLRDA